MPNSIEQYQSLANIIPKLTQQATGLIRQGLTDRAARKVGQASNVRQGLANLSEATPFAGAVDTQAPEIQQNLQLAQYREQEQKEKEAEMARKAIIDGGLPVMKKYYKSLPEKLQGLIPNPATFNNTNIDRKGIEDWYSFAGSRINTSIATASRGGGSSGRSGAFAHTAAGQEEKLAKAVSRKLVNIYPKDYTVVGKDIFGEPIYKVKPDSRAAEIENNRSKWTGFAKEWFPQLYRGAKTIDAFNSFQSDKQTEVSDAPSGSGGPPKVFNSNKELQDAFVKREVSVGDSVVVGGVKGKFK